MTHHILVFDSGFGGLTILSHVKAYLPDAAYSYLVDNAAFPYGNKPDYWLKDRALALFGKILPMIQPDLLIIACNTASTLFLDDIRAHVDIPVIGVVPALKPAAKLSASKHIGLLATSATIRRPYVQKLFDAHANGCKLYQLDGQPLVELAESFLIDAYTDLSPLDALVQNLTLDKNILAIDTIVLGCTHFPILRKPLARKWPKKIHWIDSGDAIARRAASLCENLQPSEPPDRSRLFQTAPVHLAKLHQPFQALGIREIIDFPF